MLSSFAQLRQQLHQSGPRSAVVAAAQDEHTLQAVLAARRDGLIHPILVGPPDQLRPLLDRLGASVPEEDLVPAGTEAECAARAVALVRQGRGSLLIKGHLSTGALLGAVSMQFLMHGANFLKHCGGYINTGVWSKKAKEGAAFYGDVYDVATSEGEGFRRIPGPEEFNLLPGTDYVYLTSNNTIHGTQWQAFPHFDLPLICDMSSDFLSRPVDVKNFDFIYAGIQKNVGPAGAVIGIAKHSYLETARQDLPIMLQYKTFFDHDSTYNTPPVFCIYFVNKVLHWLDERGGLKETERINKEKAAFVYDAIDASDGFYRPHAAKDSRSLMNITFNLVTPELEKEFVSQAAEEKLIGLKGHRSIGGCRASTYNAVTKEACERLADFMHRFRKAH